MALTLGCHHTPARTASTPLVWPTEEHCWWAPLHTALSPDSVAARYARAYATLGLSQSGWTHDADTAWAQGGPTTLTRPAGAGVHAARVVAYRRGDSTLVRSFVAVMPDGPVNAGTLAIPLCGDLMREAKALTISPRDEVRDDSLPVWRRRTVP